MADLCDDNCEFLEKIIKLVRMVEREELSDVEYDLSYKFVIALRAYMFEEEEGLALEKEEGFA